MKRQSRFWSPVLLLCLGTVGASAQSMRVQCPASTITHPGGNNNVEPSYTAPTTVQACTPGTPIPGSSVICPASSVYPSNVNGAIKCQQVSGGDGYATMGDGTQTYLFSFGPLSGLADIAAGRPGTQFPNVFNGVYPQGHLLITAPSGWFLIWRTTRSIFRLGRSAGPRRPALRLSP